MKNNLTSHLFAFVALFGVVVGDVSAAHLSESILLRFCGLQTSALREFVLNFLVTKNN